MKLKKQIILIISVCIFLTVALISTISIYYIRSQADLDIQKYRKEEYQKLKNNLKRYINMAYQTIDAKYKRLQDTAFIAKSYGSKLKGNVLMIDEIIKNQKSKISTSPYGKSEELIKQETLDLISKLHYDGKKGYFWVLSDEYPFPKLLMHPFLRDAIGDYLDSEGYNRMDNGSKNIFQKMVEVVQDEGESWLKYPWYRRNENQETEPIDKIGYFKRDKEWGWIYATAIDFKSIENDIISEITQTISTMSYLGKEGYFWITDSKLPYPRMILYPINPKINGLLLDNPRFNLVKGTDQNFFQAIAERCNKEGEGFVNYRFVDNNKKQYDKSVLKVQTDVTKISYSKLYKPLGWIISTSISNTPIENAIQAKTEEVNTQIRRTVTTIVIFAIVLTALGFLAAWYYSTGLTKSIITVRNRLVSMAQGEAVQKVKSKRKDEVADMTQSLNVLVDAFDNYAKFAKEVGKGNLDTEYKLLGKEDTLGIELLKMTKSLKSVEEEDRKRAWITEGNALFGNILRQHSNDIRLLSKDLLRNLTSYLKIRQGGIFLIETRDSGEQYLDLIASFAFDREKFIKKEFMLGEGLIGQCALEKLPIYMTELPEDYIKIASGLGETMPRALLVLPLIHQEEVFGVMELAALKTLAPYERAFLENLSKSFAATIAAVKANHRTRLLLDKSQRMGEELRAQEEELRQNQEEMKVTQEQLERQRKELKKENDILKKQLENKTTVSNGVENGLLHSS